MQRHGPRMRPGYKKMFTVRIHVRKRDRWISRAAAHMQWAKSVRWTRRAVRKMDPGDKSGCKPAVQLVRSADDGGHRSADRDMRVAIYYPAAVGPWLILNWDCGTRTRATLQINCKPLCNIYFKWERHTWAGPHESTNIRTNCIFSFILSACQ